jgi:hypothetical protein
LNLMIKETVPHDGFYRVALALKSRSEFPPDNTVYDSSGKVLPADGSIKGTSARADYENPAVFPVLADNLFAHKGTGAMTFPNATVKGTVTVPNLNCDRCILQVIEFMTPHGWNANPDGSSNGGYFYHHCAEIKITADTSLPLFVPPGADGGAPDAAPADAQADSSAAGTGGNSGAAGTTGAAGSGGGGASGAGGSTSGTGGTTGGAGTSGSGGGITGGAGTTGAAGSTAGAAGTTGAGGSKPRESSGGGCAYSGESDISALGLLVLIGGIVYSSSRVRGGRRR